jgi:hypothetical protein
MIARVASQRERESQVKKILLRRNPPLSYQPPLNNIPHFLKGGWCSAPMCHIPTNKNTTRSLTIICVHIKRWRASFFLFLFFSLPLFNKYQTRGDGGPPPPPSLHGWTGERERGWYHLCGISSSLNIDHSLGAVYIYTCREMRFVYESWYIGEPTHTLVEREREHIFNITCLSLSVDMARVS